MKRVILEVAASAVAVCLLAWTAFNVGFEYGADNSACVAFSMTTDVPVRENPFCTRADPDAVPVFHGLRTAWLAVTD